MFCVKQSKKNRHKESRNILSFWLFHEKAASFHTCSGHTDEFEFSGLQVKTI